MAFIGQWMKELGGSGDSQVAAAAAAAAVCETDETILEKENDGQTPSALLRLLCILQSSLFASGMFCASPGRGGACGGRGRQATCIGYSV